jgi:hypothetical protein
MRTSFRSTNRLLLRLFTIALSRGEAFIFYSGLSDDGPPGAIAFWGESGGDSSLSPPGRAPLT